MLMMKARLVAFEGYTYHTCSDIGNSIGLFHIIIPTSESQ